MPCVPDSYTSPSEVPLQPETNVFAGELLSCTAYDNRVADLEGSLINHNFIGWPLDGGGNQRWIFSGPDHFQKMSVVHGNDTPGVGRPIYATTRGDQIYGTDIADWASHYNLDVVGVRGGLLVWRISCAEACNGQILCWTLPNGVPGEKIVLQPWTGSATQKWYKYRG